jgi:glycosyltransferase involved in cell wall biosynthesis
MTLKNIISNRLIMPTSIKLADVIVADSTHTANDIIKYFPKSKSKVKVVLLGVEKSISYLNKSANLAKVKESIGDNFPYFLSLGSYEPRKNLETVYKAFKNVADKLPHHLICAGPSGWKTENLQREFMTGPLKNRIHLVGYVKDDIVSALFSCAEAFLFPSIYEGFGLPVIEAMSYGCPVITSNVSSIPEVAADAAIKVDPLDYVKISEHMTRFVQDNEFRNDYISRGLKRVEMLSWGKTASNMFKIFKELIQHKG